MEAFLHLFGICGHGITGHPTVIGLFILIFTGAFTGKCSAIKYMIKSPLKKQLVKNETKEMVRMERK